MSHTEDLLRAWVETVEDYAIILLDKEGRIASWNAGAERLLKHEEEEVLGRPSSIIYTSEDIALGVPEMELREALTTGRARDERWHVRKDGTRFWGF
jgi:PAS domain S-box-containing protein